MDKKNSTKVVLSNLKNQITNKCSIQATNLLEWILNQLEMGHQNSSMEPIPQEDHKQTKALSIECLTQSKTSTKSSVESHNRESSQPGEQLHNSKWRPDIIMTKRRALMRKRAILNQLMEMSYPWARRPAPEYPFLNLKAIPLIRTKNKTRYTTEFRKLKWRKWSLQKLGPWLWNRRI